jgi:hypothetical protein
MSIGKQACKHRKNPELAGDLAMPDRHTTIGDTLAAPLCLKMARWLETEWCGFVPPPHLN